jgi:hypothetical protein
LRAADAMSAMPWQEHVARRKLAIDGRHRHVGDAHVAVGGAPVDDASRESTTVTVRSSSRSVVVVACAQREAGTRSAPAFSRREMAGRSG